MIGGGLTRGKTSPTVVFSTIRLNNRPTKARLIATGGWWCFRGRPGRDSRGEACRQKDIKPTDDYVRRPVSPWAAKKYEVGRFDGVGQLKVHGFASSSDVYTRGG